MFGSMSRRTPRGRTSVLQVFGASLLFALLVSVVARPARAEPPSSQATPVYVLSVWTNNADDQADALTQQLRSRVRSARGWSLLDTSQSFETLAIALRCPQVPNTACLDRIGEQLHADHYIWGLMSKQAGTVTTDLHLWSRGKPQVDASETYSSNLKDPSDDALRAIAARLLEKLTGADAKEAPVAHAETAPSTAMPPASASDNEPEASTTRSAPFPVRKVVAYSALVAGAGFLVAAIVEGAGWLSDKSASDNDRASIPSTVTDVCASSIPAAVDACQQSANASSTARLGWIFTGVGAALAGTGLVLILTDKGNGDASTEPAQASARSQPARVALWPTIGPHAGRLDLKVTF